MSDLKEAGNLLRRAEMDLKAVQGMGDVAVFTDEVFGGRVQETAEKLFKAWLAIHGVKYPRTHDLALLLRLLGEHREPAAKFEELVEYTAYITKFRYGVLPEPAAPLEREAVGKILQILRDAVRRGLEKAEGGPSPKIPS